MKSYVAKIYFKSFGYYEGTELMIHKYFSEYNPKEITYSICFKALSISEISTEIKRLVKYLYDLDSFTSIDFVTSKELYQHLNKKTLFCDQTLLQLFSEEGISIREE